MTDRPRQTDQPRKLIALPPSLYTFQHDTLVSPLLVSAPSLFTARCRTNRPATRCECGMYDLEWDR